MTGKEWWLVTLKRRAIDERSSTVYRHVKPRTFSWLFSQLLTSTVPWQEYSREENSKMLSNVLGCSLSAKDTLFAR